MGKRFEYRDLIEIINESDTSYLSYKVLLFTNEWKKFRDQIVRRDKGQCKKCGELPNQLAWHIGQDCGIYERPPTWYEKEYMGEQIIYCSRHVVLNVHHKYYIKDKFPWEYSLDALTTLCSECHEQVHQNDDIYIYQDEHLNKFTILKNCTKCKGTGYLKEYYYNEHGICFDCLGYGSKDKAFTYNI
ncbi:hypothetical protein J8L88_09910 [Aquimarina sp. MMG015]|uniref:hypothetical protein n=1 Tax=Aquimarina sp. MMG015 TaxID=2822689 RepID=UPI001B3A7895|nr:hypothetical protein [Aquimarina sp. MMG015]MBQ4803163.1 hypothetical protein [Aquimarina sp. MMG015]